MAESLGCTPLMRKVRILKGLKDSQYLNMADTRLIVVSLDFIECTELRNTSVDEKFTSHTYSTQHSPTVLPRMTRTEGRKDAKMAVVRLPSWSCLSMIRFVVWLFSLLSKLRSDAYVLDGWARSVRSSDSMHLTLRENLSFPEIQFRRAWDINYATYDTRPLLYMALPTPRSRHSWNGVRRVRKRNDGNHSLIGAPADSFDVYYSERWRIGVTLFVSTLAAIVLVRNSSLGIGKYGAMN